MSFWKTSNENCWKYNHRQGDTSRDTSSVDAGQLAPPNSTRPGGPTWQATSPGPARIKVRQRRVDLLSKYGSGACRKAKAEGIIAKTEECFSSAIGADMISAKIRFTVALGIALTKVLSAMAQESTPAADPKQNPTEVQVLDRLIEQNEQLEKQNQQMEKQNQQLK